MSKTVVFVLKEEGGVLLVNPKPEEYAAFPHVINPVMSHVRGIPPQLWRIEGGKVVAKDGVPLPEINTASLDELWDKLEACEMRLKQEVEGLLTKLQEASTKSEEREQESVARCEKTAFWLKVSFVLNGILLGAVIFL